MEIKATPRRIRFCELNGYILVVKITHGPQNMIDRIVTINLTAEQLDAISEWDPDEVRVCDLTKEGG